MVPGLEQDEEMNEFDENNPSSPGSRPSSSARTAANLARACDYCRQRKAGCSRDKPQCRNCKNAKRQCTYTDPVLRKENPTVKLSGQLSTLGTRLSRIESLLPTITQGSPPQSTSPPAALSEETNRKLNCIESRIHAIEDKLDSVLSLLSALTSAKHTNGTSSDESSRNRDGTSRPDSVDGEEDSRNTAPAAEHLAADESGNVYYLGRSSNYSFTADAEILVHSRLKGAKSSTVSRHDSLHGSSNQEVESQAWDGEENIEGEEEARILSGMASHLGDMSNSRECAPQREQGISSELVGETDREYDLGPQCPKGKGGKDEQFEIPTEAEGTMIMARIYRNVSAGLPFLYKIPTLDMVQRILYHPEESLADDKIDTATVTMTFCLSYFVLALDMNTLDAEGYKTELKLKRRMAKNAWLSFRDLRLFLTPGISHVQALMMMGIIAQDNSRPGLCWMLVCQACRLAQAMGLHRKVNPGNTANLTADDIRVRTSLFWMLYLLDKSFSLSFGRTPCFQDYDCDVELPPLSEMPLVPKLGPSTVTNCFEPNHFRAMVELAKLQSLVYEKLYSVKGSGVEEAERNVWELDAKLRALKDGAVFNIATLAFAPLDIQNANIHEDYIIAAENLVFSYHTLMTMIHRRIYNPTKNNQGEGNDSRFRSRNILLLSARSAIQIVRKLGLNHKNYTKTRWLILFHPFAPFFVLFSKIVTCPNSPTNDVDIELMCFVEKFLEDIRNTTCLDDDEEKGSGTGMKRLQTVVKAFIRVARSFIRRDKERLQKSMMQQQQDREGGSDSGVEWSTGGGGGTRGGSEGAPSGPRVEALRSERGTASASSSSLAVDSSPTPENGRDVQLTGMFSPLGALGESTTSSTKEGGGGNGGVSGASRTASMADYQRSLDYLNHSAQTYRSFQQTQLDGVTTTDGSNNGTQIPPAADDNEAGFVRWNTSVPSLSLNNLQDLASMDLDFDIPYDAIPAFDGYTNPALQARGNGRGGQAGTGYIGQPTQGLVPGNVSYGNVNYQSHMSAQQHQQQHQQHQQQHHPGGYPAGGQQGAGGAARPTGVGNDFMAVFESGVRQGAMDFDWINWEA